MRTVSRRPADRLAGPEGNRMSCPVHRTAAAKCADGPGERRDCRRGGPELESVAPAPHGGGDRHQIRPRQQQPGLFRVRRRGGVDRVQHLYAEQETGLTGFSPTAAGRPRLIALSSAFTK